MRNWISIEDGYPCGVWHKNYQHLSERVLVVNSCRIHEIAFFNRKDKTWYCDAPMDNQWIDKITHWMPLPELPK